MLTMRPPAGTKAAHGGAAAQIATDEVHVQHVQHAGLVGVGHAAHGEAAGDVDRRPQVGDAIVQPRDIVFVGQVAVADQRDAILMGEGGSLRVDDVGYPAACAGGQQGGHHRGAQSTGAAGDDDGLIGEWHRRPPLLCGLLSAHSNGKADGWQGGHAGRHGGGEASMTPTDPGRASGSAGVISPFAMPIRHNLSAIQMRNAGLTFPTAVSDVAYMPG